MQNYFADIKNLRAPRR